MASVLARLRDVVPMRPLTPGEAIRIAELQAVKLLELSGTAAPSVPESIIASLPRIDVQRLCPIPVSGSAHWARGRWVIVLNGDEPPTRQRFSMAHEFKHVLDSAFVDFLYRPLPGQTSHARGEQVADYFAACLLMPRVWVKRSWGAGVQDVHELAAQFEVSPAAMKYRLMQLGMLQRTGRCAAAA